MKLGDNQGMAIQFKPDECCETQNFGEDPVPDEAHALMLQSSVNPETAPQLFSPDPQMQISKYFKLADLIVTSLPHPNLPDDQASLDNLIKMGVLLDAIQDNVGTFNIASVYRSQANQDELRKANTMAVSKSYHSLGLAADLTPTNGMTPTLFAQTLYQNPLTNALLGQIVDKSEGGNQTSLHISITTPKFPKATPMYVGSDHQYYRMTQAQIGSWLSSQMSDMPAPGEAVFTPEEGELVTEDEMNDEGSSIPWKWLLGGSAVAALAYFFYKKRRA